MRVFRPVLADHDLTEQQWRAIRALAAATEPMTTGELAEATFLLGPSLSRIMVALEDRGLISRTQDPSDQRRIEVQLSASGAELYTTIAPISEQAYASIEARFGSKRLSKLLSELHELEASLTESQAS